jgi:hypothetical protein
VEDHRVVEEGEARGKATMPPSRRSGFLHYLIARRETTGFELPHTFFHLGEEVLPVFSSDETARRCLASLALGGGWYVRGFSPGELVSLLFVLHERVAWVLPNPLPEHLLAEVELSHLTSRDSFIEFLMAH